MLRSQSGSLLLDLPANCPLRLVPKKASCKPQKSSINFRDNTVFWWLVGCFFFGEPTQVEICSSKLFNLWKAKGLLYIQVGFCVGPPNHRSLVDNRQTETPAMVKNLWNMGCCSSNELHGCSKHHQTRFAWRIISKMQTRAIITLAWATQGTSCQPSGLWSDLPVLPRDLKCWISNWLY